MHIDLFTQLPQKVSIIPSCYSTTSFYVVHKQHTFGSCHGLGFLGAGDPGNFQILLRNSNVLPSHVAPSLFLIHLHKPRVKPTSSYATKWTHVRTEESVWLAKMFLIRTEIRVRTASKST